MISDRGWILVAALLAAACEDPRCGDILRYSREAGTCVCPNGGRWLAQDGGENVCVLPDGSTSTLDEMRDGATSGEDAGTDAGRPPEPVDGGTDACALRTLYQDRDGDGFGDPASTMQSCEPVAGWVEDATDCDDGCAACHPGAPELCDELDNDCDRVVDDGVVNLTFYADCDRDGFAPTGAPSIVGCAPPASAPATCAGGTWTTRAPTAGQADCFDNVPEAFPGQTMFFERAIAGAPAAVDYDYDCNGSEQLEITLNRGSDYQACSRLTGGLECILNGPAWSRFPAAPDCGVIADLAQCFDGCESRWVPHRQRCR